MARHVYIIELAPEAAAHIRGARRGRPIFYVGQTALRTSERLARHRGGGITSNHLVERYGRRIVREAGGPFETEEEAEREERAVAVELRRLGATVVGGH